MNDLERARMCADKMFQKDRSSKALGIDVDIPVAGTAVATMRVRDDMLNGFDVCHGGLVFTLADTAFAFACNAYNVETLGASASIEWLRPSRRGDTLTAIAEEERRDGRHGFYAIIVANQKDELVAVFHGHCISRGEPIFDESSEPA